ncbi:DUF421 domain-containing protein [Bacillus sp. M6-12]|uniref:DUF421 domain-containing protein n=1 Tax=Bacillus sp. M6-12 TaxID=2054166 RepID=UPI000C75FC96|nr:DUF421 domain-containing protein [Bacillus sp. M6-12]PLS17640.1 DUF421 domain-containing protein [Bacillus sp. M6-12]
MEYAWIALEIVSGFIALFILTKVLGKTELSQITTFDFISVLVLGELVGNAMYDPKVHVGIILFSIVLWGGLIYSLEKITQKFQKTRPLLEGDPSLVINKGKIDYKTMKSNNLDLNQLQCLLRAKDVFSLRDVEYAVLETNGTISVLKSYESETPSRKDFQMGNKSISLPLALILDGKVVKKNLEKVGRDQQWLTSIIQQKGVKNIKEVFFAEYEEGREIFIQDYS